MEFGKRYRVNSEGGGKHDPWLMRIVCRHGHIYPHGGPILGASTDKRGAVAKRLAALGCTSVVQDGDDGVNVVFNVDDFAQVAKVMKPRRRKQLSKKQREAVVARLRAFRFVARENDSADLESTIVAEGDPWSRRGRTGCRGPRFRRKG